MCICIRECTRGGFCNFMHLKPISRELKRELYIRLNHRRKHRSVDKLCDFLLVIFCFQKFAFWDRPIVFGSSVRASVRDSRGSFMFPRYLQYLLTDFRQSFVTGASQDRDELVRFWGQKVKVQGHGMTECIQDFHVSTISPVSIDRFSPNFCHWCILGHR